MNKLTSLDVLIVYTETLAGSASDLSVENITPFPHRSRNESYNTVYGYFLETCDKFGLTAAFATSDDIIGPGFCHSFWKFQDKKWIKVNSPCFSALIFDKFSPTNSSIKSRRQLLFSSEGVKPFNDPDLFNLFFDKFSTYEKLSKYSIPTVSLEGKTLQDVNNACRMLAKLLNCHPYSKDFNSDIVMKDRFGAGGRHVYKFINGQAKNMLAVIRRNSKLSFIIQPFLNFDHGFSYHNCSACTDIRIIYLNGKIIQSYIRVAKSGEFRCNEHQGGLLTYLPLKEIPSALVTKSNLIAETLNKKSAFYSLDFIISNNGNIYLLEGNTGPGLDWNMLLKQNEIESKKLIRLVVKELSTRVQPRLTFSNHKLSPVDNIKYINYPKLALSRESP